MSTKLFISVILVLVGATFAFAQEWVESESGAEFNCDTINMIVAEFGDESFSRSEHGTVTLQQFFSSLIQDCAVSPSQAATQRGMESSSSTDFKVTVNSTVNVRDCAGTTCTLVGTTKNGDILEVIGEDGDWYKIKFDGGTAFIASWLTERLPDALIETDEPYFIDSANCFVVPSSSRSSDMDINVIITGDRKEDVVVDLYRPNNDAALRVEGQLDKTFIDTGETYIHQYYYWNIRWPTGIYNIEVEMDNVVHRIAWNVTERADYNFFVSCD